MNPLAVRAARLARLSQQSQILQQVDRNQRRVSDVDGPVLDLDRAPFVLQALGVPLTLSRATLTGADFVEVDKVRAWYGMLLTGIGDEHLAVLVGDGSNYTAAALCRNAVRRALTVAWYSWHDFTRRYTDSITRSRVLDHATSEEQAEAAQEVYAAESEDLALRHVYDLLAIVDFDIADVRDFAVTDICSLWRDRLDAGLTTVVTVAAVDAGPLEQESRHFGPRGALLRWFEQEGRIFDGRQ